MKRFLVSFSNKSGLIDWWSLNHLISGVVCGFIFIFLKGKFPWLKEPKYFFGVGFILFVFWEIIEMIIRYFKKYFTVPIMKPFVEYESNLNVISDIIVCLIGLWIVYTIFNKS